MNKWRVMVLLGLASVLVLSSSCSRSKATKDAGESKETEQQGNGADTDESEEAPGIEDLENAEKIGILLPSEQWDSRWKVDAASLEIKFDDFGYLPLIEYAGEDPELQKQQLKELVDQDVKALIVAPVDVYALTDELKKAAEKSIPIFSYDHLIMDTGDIDYYMTFDSRTVGNQVGEKILAAMNLPSDPSTPFIPPLKMELLMGSPDSVQSLFFYNGLMEVIEPYITSGSIAVPSGRISFDDTAVMDYDRKTAAARYDSICEEFYKGGMPDILVTADEDYAVEILKEYRFSEKVPYITTAGCKLETVKKIASGAIGATVFLDNRMLGQSCAETVHTLLKGDEDPEISDYEQYDNGVKIVSTIFVGTEVIDRDNYQMLADNGYFTEAELRIQLSPTPAPEQENEEVTPTASPEKENKTATPTASPEQEKDAAEPTVSPENKEEKKQEEEKQPSTVPENGSKKKTEISPTPEPEKKK